MRIGIIGRGRLMHDPQIHGTIEQLVAEGALAVGARVGGQRDRGRRQAVKVSLDQCWDLLRQRRALRGAGRDPEAADVRGPEVGERYEQ